MPHEVADQVLVVADRFRPRAVGDAGRLHDGGIVPHVIDDADEAAVEHRELVAEDALQRRRGGAAGGGRGFGHGAIIPAARLQFTRGAPIVGMPAPAGYGDKRGME